MSLKRIHLELARCKEFPEGSRALGYDFVAPLDDAGHLQADIWRRERQRCHVRRFWAGTPDEIGLLVHKRGGTWAFDYDPNSADDDEPGFKFDRHYFVPGEYVSITEHDDVQRTFRVVSVRDFA
jgi:hypothetical protein